MNEQFVNQLLAPAHESWRGFLRDALGRMDPVSIQRLEENPGWLPGYDKCFAAFCVPRECVKVVWLGESPYPRPESANGFSFWDANIQCVFGSNGGLSAEVNKVASLRNLFKAWFVATGRLQKDATSKDHIPDMPKDGLAVNVAEVFENGLREGWLWLNTGLSLYTGPNAEKKEVQICRWLPLVESVLQDASRGGAEIVLLGEKARKFELSVDNPITFGHLRPEKFVQDEGVHNFLSRWGCIIETNES